MRPATGTRAKEVHGAVLVASTDAASNFNKFYFHQMMEASTIGLGFDASKDLRVEGNHFVFGDDDDSRPDNLHLSRFMLERAQSDMSREFFDE